MSDALNAYGLATDGATEGLHGYVISDLPQGHLIRSRGVESWEARGHEPYNPFRRQFLGMWEALGESFTRQFGPEGWES